MCNKTVKLKSENRKTKKKSFIGSTKAIFSFKAPGCAPLPEVYSKLLAIYLYEDDLLAIFANGPFK